MERVTAAEMSMYLASDRRGQWFAEVGPGEWMALDNKDGTPAMFRGSLRDVLETFIPFDGTVREIMPGEFTMGIERTSDMCRRFPLAETVKQKRRNGVKKNPVRKENERRMA